MSTITALVSDTHIGGYTSLSLPEWQCDDYKYQATLAQNWIYEKWQDFWGYVKQLAGKKHRVVVFHLGDVIDGFHPRYIQAMSNIDDQRAMAVEMLKPIVNMADKTYIIRGTECHVGQGAQNEVAIARELGVPCVWEGIYNVDGTVIDVSHHGRASKRYWTSAAVGMAAESVMEAVSDIPARVPPRYVFRGHMHLIDDSGEKVNGTRCVCLPSWELRNALGYRLESGRRTDVGGVIILPDGQLDLSHLRYFAAPGQRKVVKV